MGTGTSYLRLVVSGVFILGALILVQSTTEVPRYSSLDCPEFTRDTDTSRRADLGADLFRERLVSRDSSLSCATCHSPQRAFAETLQVSRGIGRDAQRRNTPSILDVGRFSRALNWDGGAGSLEQQLSGVFAVHGDMGIELETVVKRLRGNSLYRSRFMSAYGRLPDEAAVRDALVAFQKRLSSGPLRFERYYLYGDSTALSESEQRGQVLFNSSRTGCSGCHLAIPEPGGTGQLAFRDDRYHNLGIGFSSGRFADSGRFTVSKRPQDLGAFATPSLRNVVLTALYMHDGSIATLEEVVDFYTKGGIQNRNLDAIMIRRELSAGERRDLVAFLHSMSSDWLSDTAQVRRCYFTTTHLLH